MCVASGRGSRVITGKKVPHPIRAFVVPCSSRRSNHPPPPSIAALRRARLWSWAAFFSPVPLAVVFPLDEQYEPIMITPGNQRRLEAVMRRQTIRAQAGLNLLDVLREIKHLKAVEEEQAFQIWAESYRAAVEEEILRQTKPFRPYFMFGMWLDNEIRRVLMKAYKEQKK